VALAAEVDGAVCCVRLGDASWPFELDCRTGAATLALDSGTRTVAPLRWREKVVLARFARLGGRLVDEHVLRLVTAGEPPQDEAERAGLLALATWVNTPPDAPGSIPLETRVLASITFDVCRAMGLKPADLDSRDAVEIEALWHVGTELQALPAGPPGPAPAGVVSSARNDWEGPVTRIVVVPDPDDEAESEGSDEGEEVAESASGSLDTASAVTEPGAVDSTISRAAGAASSEPPPGEQSEARVAPVAADAIPSRRLAPNRGTGPTSSADAELVAIAGSPVPLVQRAAEARQRIAAGVPEREAESTRPDGWSKSTPTLPEPVAPPPQPTEPVLPHARSAPAGRAATDASASAAWAEVPTATFAVGDVAEVEREALFEELSERLEQAAEQLGVGAGVV